MKNNEIGYGRSPHVPMTEGGLRLEHSPTTHPDNINKTLASLGYQVLYQKPEYQTPTSDSLIKYPPTSLVYKDYLIATPRDPVGAWLSALIIAAPANTIHPDDIRQNLSGCLQKKAYPPDVQIFTTDPHAVHRLHPSYNSTSLNPFTINYQVQRGTTGQHETQPFNKHRTDSPLTFLNNQQIPGSYIGILFVNGAIVEHNNQLFNFIIFDQK